MLILTRNIGEAIVINGNIRIIPFNISGNQVKLGIEAPMDVSVHREEVQERINKEKEERGNE